MEMDIGPLKIKHHGQKLGILKDFVRFCILYVNTFWANHVGSMWVPYGCGEKNVMSFRKTNMLGQFGIATTDVCCETWVRMLNIIQPSFSSNSQWDSRRVEPKTFKSRTLYKHVSTVCGCCRTTIWYNMCINKYIYILHYVYLIIY